MQFHLLTIITLLAISVVCTNAQAQLEPQIPLDANWGISIEQVEGLSNLEQAANGALQGSYTIRGGSQTELVARWQGRAISFYFARDFGLYAINVDMILQRTLRSPVAADREMLDLEQCAPVRLAVMRKYGPAQGIASTWDSKEIASLSANQILTEKSTETQSIAWPYARNWLIWEGKDTRLALGERSVWYVSQAGLAHREQAKQAFAKEITDSLEREQERRVVHQRQLDEARQTVPSRAQQLEPLF